MEQNPKKKILYVITKSNWGGAQRYVYDLATEVSKNNRYDVSVAVGGSGTLKSRLEESSIVVMPIRSLQRDVRLLSDIKVFFELLTFFQKEKPDVIHLNSSKVGVIGGLAAIHQFCRIGKMSIIGGCSKVVQDVPPFMMADGNPAQTRTINKIGMERNGVSEEAMNAVKQAYKILFREKLTISNALDRIEADLPQLPEIKHLVQFGRTSERGLSK